MTNRDSPLRRAIRTANEDEARVRADLARARRGAGLSREAVGRAAGLSRSALERLETGARRSTVRELAAVGSAVGLDVRLRAYPAGDPVRDAGQLRLLERLRSRLDGGLSWRTEVPLPIEGDRRAWDAVIGGTRWLAAVEAETVLDDLQAIERRVALKQRDGGIDHVVVLVADTRRNRRALAAAPHAFAGFSRDARTVLRALGAGRDPECSAILIL
ncbi:MAG TPA: helix-turn-helix transcriptional regulator [Patescibacteria group bacterium]|nr:helix-turn-helix transcriptional regulator [Patescibacteria group bacterium]